jgi:acidic leucine-rich nuclear phosphoprotein 32 family protein B/acidic leucine-rich nuclear phosphoprotein 32 family protein E
VTLLRRPVTGPSPSQAELADLDAIDLESNPIADDDDYPNIIFDLLTNVTYIDGKDKDGEELESDGSDEDEEEDGDENDAEEDEEEDGR